MSKKYLKLTTIALGLATFICGVSISFSSVNAASTTINPENCYDESYDESCPAQTTATVTVSGSSTHTVSIQTGPNGTWSLKIPAVGEISVPAIGGKTTKTVTGTDGTTYTLVINIGSSYRVLCHERTSPGGQPCNVIDCRNNIVQTYRCDHPGGTSTSNY